MFGSCIGVGWERPLHVVTYPFSLKTTRKHYQEMQPAPWRNTSVVPLYGEVMKRTLLDISNACLGLRDVLSGFFFLLRIIAQLSVLTVIFVFSSSCVFHFLHFSRCPLSHSHSLPLLLSLHSSPSFTSWLCSRAPSPSHQATRDSLVCSTMCTECLSMQRLFLLFWIPKH